MKKLEFNDTTDKYRFPSIKGNIANVFSVWIPLEKVETYPLGFVMNMPNKGSIFGNPFQKAPEWYTTLNHQYEAFVWRMAGGEGGFGGYHSAIDIGKPGKHRNSVDIRLEMVTVETPGFEDCVGETNDATVRYITQKLKRMGKKGEHQPAPPKPQLNPDILSSAVPDNVSSSEGFYSSLDSSVPAAVHEQGKANSSLEQLTGQKTEGLPPGFKAGGLFEHNIQTPLLDAHEGPRRAAHGQTIIPEGDLRLRHALSLNSKTSYRSKRMSKPLLMLEPEVDNIYQKALHIPIRRTRLREKRPNFEHAAKEVLRRALGHRVQKNVEALDIRDGGLMHERPRLKWHIFSRDDVVPPTKAENL